MTTFVFVAVLAILGFLRCSGPDGFMAPKHRHGTESPEAAPRVARRILDWRVWIRATTQLSPALYRYRSSVLNRDTGRVAMSPDRPRRDSCVAA
jgi:hypothetical protein